MPGFETALVIGILAFGAVSQAIAQPVSFQQANPGNPGAEAKESVPAEIEAVATAGYWTQGSERGQYRITIRTSGVEHLISVMTVEWLKDPDRENPRRVVASQTVETGRVRLGEPQLSLEKGVWHLKVWSVDTHINPMVEKTLHFVLGPPNAVSRVGDPK